jgi:hypothetical protein
VGRPPCRGRLPGPEAGIELYWLPLGAGGWFVRLNGRIWEAIHALLEHRRPLDLYHTALQVRLPEGRFVVENCWPIPDADGAARGVVVQGPVASRRMARFRVFRYEVRRWRDGVIGDADEAVASPQLLSDDPVVARRLLDLVGCLPSPVWGRDELGTGEMWNSNSVISWLLARSGLPVDAIGPSAGGRAPGWEAGLVTARRQQRSEERAGHGAGGATMPVEGGGSSSRWMRYWSGSGRSWSARGSGAEIDTHNPSNPAQCREGSGLSSKPTKVNSYHHRRAAAPPGPEDQGRTEEAGGKHDLIEFRTLGPHRVGLPALGFGRDGGEAEGSFGSSAGAT